MISLRQAFKLCKIRDDELVYLRPRGGSRFSSDMYTGKEVRNKLDMKRIDVISIDVRLSYGEWKGFEFEIIDRTKGGLRNVQSFPGSVL